MIIVISFLAFLFANAFIVKFFRLNRVLKFEVSGDHIVIEDITAIKSKTYSLPEHDILLTKEAAIKFVSDLISDYSKSMHYGSTIIEKYFNLLFRPALIVTLNEHTLCQRYPYAQYENLAHAIKRVSGVNSVYTQQQ